LSLIGKTWRQFRRVCVRDKWVQMVRCNAYIGFARTPVLSERNPHSDAESSCDT
jgi:hypothetical protein